MANPESSVSSKDKKNLAKNAISLFFLQGSTYILSLITVPYLFQTLGVEKFGLVNFSLSVAMFFLILSDYGFNTSVPREISVNRDNIHAVSKIFCTVIFLKMFLVAVLFIVFLGIVFFVPRFTPDYPVHLLTFGVVFGQALFPLWFFQGMEEMQYTTIFNIMSKVLFTLLIFVFVRNPSDYLLVPIFTSLGFIMGGILSQYMVFTKFKVKLLLPDFGSIKHHICDSFHFFIAQLSFHFYGLANTLVLGYFTNNTLVGYYTAAEKIIKAFKCLINPIANTIYPYMARKQNILLFKKVFYGACLGGLLLCLFFFFGSNIIAHVLYKPDEMVTARLLRLFSLQFLILFPSIMLGVGLLIPMGRSNYQNMSVIIGAVVHIIGLIIIVPIINPYLLIILTLVTDAIVCSIKIYAVHKYRLWKT